MILLFLLPFLITLILALCGFFKTNKSGTLLDDQSQYTPPLFTSGTPGDLPLPNSVNESSQNQPPQQAFTTSSSLPPIVMTNRDSSNEEKVFVRCVYPFEPEGSTEMALKPGDIILLTGENDEWFKGNLDGIVGWFPKTYVEHLNSDPRLHVPISRPLPMPKKSTQLKRTLPVVPKEHPTDDASKRPLPSPNGKVPTPVPKGPFTNQGQI
eukprot:TRINITY_DN11056_c0_g1_i1.p1 TRINITY_DN11056_c0_g1~~TRINITY_DN11056_c0_g1_i1.p1  ORF type:complete len:226 (-),score=40.41 TRINITY_DN11056_c0_g1_i1:17-646(-)